MKFEIWLRPDTARLRDAHASKKYQKCVFQIHKKYFMLYRVKIACN